MIVEILINFLICDKKILLNLRQFFQISMFTFSCYTETDSFLVYALPSHSWSEGSGSCRNLQERAPYFSIKIMTQTTKRVRQAVAGQKTCKPIARDFIYTVWDYQWTCLQLSSNTIIKITCLWITISIVNFPINYFVEKKLKKYS